MFSCFGLGFLIKSLGFFLVGLGLLDQIINLSNSVFEYEVLLEKVLPENTTWQVLSNKKQFNCLVSLRFL